MVTFECARSGLQPHCRLVFLSKLQAMFAAPASAHLRLSKGELPPVTVCRGHSQMMQTTPPPTLACAHPIAPRLTQVFGCAQQHLDALTNCTSNNHNIIITPIALVNFIWLGNVSTSSAAWRDRVP